MYLNSVLIIGNLTKDPEMKTLPNGTKVTSFSLATNRKWKDAQQQIKEAVEYHNVVVFGRQAETSAQYLKKGSQAMVQGRNQTRSWDDAGTGKKMYRTEVIAENVQFGRRAEGVAPSTQAPASAPAVAPAPTHVNTPVAPPVQAPPVATAPPVNTNVSNQMSMAEQQQAYLDSGNINPEDIPF